jgi:putative ABC transport system permease protein
MSLATFDLLELTYRSLRSNLLRSALTTLGVFMGVAAVSATLQVGSISRAVIAQQLAQREAPQVTVGLMWDPSIESPRLRLEDIEFLQQRLAGLQAISATQWVGPTQTVFQDREAKPLMFAVSQDFALTSGRPLLAGRFFTPADFENYRPVVVIDQFLADKLFPSQDAVGKRIYAERRPYIVVGVVPTRLEGNSPPEGELAVPMSVYSVLTGSGDIEAIRMRPYHIEDLEELGEQAKLLLMQRFPYHFTKCLPQIKRQECMPILSKM